MEEPRVEGLLFGTRARPARAACLVDGAEVLEHAELVARAERVARGLVGVGIRPGERVALDLGHAQEAIVALLAVWRAGAVAVPLGPTLRAPQCAHVLWHSDSRVLLCAPRRTLARDCALAAGRPVLELAGDGEGFGSGAVGELPRDLPGGETPAALLYTSGSSGRAKGILVSHANLLSGARIVSGYLELGNDERILCVLPLSFDYGLNQLLCALQVGGTLVLQRSHLPADVLATLARERITGLAGVPPFWITLLGGGSGALALPHLRYLTNSGGVFPRELTLTVRRRLAHVRLYLMYGLSEAFRSTYLAPEELERHPDSIGKAIPECEVLVLDEEGRPCAAGETGELVHRGPTVALGYWNDPEASARVFRADPAAPGGRRRVHSGDLVRRDEQGFLYFVGRRDALIKSHGYRISPDEVEELLQASPLVQEAVVHGRAHALAGATVVAHVVPREPERFSLAALLEHCRACMPGYMVPSSIEVHAALPRTSTGKVDRWALAR